MITEDPQTNTATNPQTDRTDYNIHCAAAARSVIKTRSGRMDSKVRLLNYNYPNYYTAR